MTPYIIVRGEKLEACPCGTVKAECPYHKPEPKPAVVTEPADGLSVWSGEFLTHVATAFYNVHRTAGETDQSVRQRCYDTLRAMGTGQTRNTNKPGAYTPIRWDTCVCGKADLTGVQCLGDADYVHTREKCGPVWKP